jgi:SAM-dependent methyltransferase
MAKVRDSGMPSREQWEGYFDPAAVLDTLGCRNIAGDIVEFGCGYGTFTVPAATRTAATLYALDIDPVMVAATTVRVRAARLGNVTAEERDFVRAGCGRPEASAGYALLFNILHLDDPVALLGEARRVLAHQGAVGVIHWRVDVVTPRGPALEFRPGPAQCQDWARAAGLVASEGVLIPGAPWHWGMVLRRL